LDGTITGHLHRAPSDHHPTVVAVPDPELHSTAKLHPRIKVGYLTVNSSKGTIFILLPGDKLVIVLVMVAPLPVNVLVDIPGKWEELNM